jgi:hypothetical protein
MKVALCISGQPREFKRSYPSLKEHVIDKVDTDVFVYCWDAKKQPYFEIEGAIRYPDEGSVNELIDLYKPVSYVLEPWDDEREKSFYNEKYEINRGLHSSIVRYQAMLYSIFKCNELKNEYEKKRNISYDIVIKARSDLKLSRSIDLDELAYAYQNRILYSDVLRWDGMVSDILFFGNKEVMDIAARLYYDFDGYHDEGVPFNTEIMFPHHLSKNRVKPRQHIIGGVEVLRPAQVKWS